MPRSSPAALTGTTDVDNVVHMKTATLRDLRNDFGRLEAWLAEGETIEIRRRGKPVGMLSPVANGTGLPKPDFAARRRAIWGDRVFTKKEVAEMRAYELEGQEG